MECKMMNESSEKSETDKDIIGVTIPTTSENIDSEITIKHNIDTNLSEEERCFYISQYPTIDLIRDRKVHCTVCKVHIGTAPIQENVIKMHPILRVTHCVKCHEFYNSGEFSKGEDGSELYCRWCGQGGEVYCCSSCPYVFCKTCIIKNLSRGIITDIEQNENWNCFSCVPKIIWPLRAQHWALMCYIEQQKKEIFAKNLSEHESKQQMSVDRSRCCRSAKARCGNMSDSMESLDSIVSRPSHSSSNSNKRFLKSAGTSPHQNNAIKRFKNNDEVVCTPDLISMLEPDCQITVSRKQPLSSIINSSSGNASVPPIRSMYSGVVSPSTTPSVFVNNNGVSIRTTRPILKRTIVNPKTTNPVGARTPVYHTINGFRVDLNSASQQKTFRLPNGKLIQVKRQVPVTMQNSISNQPITVSTATTWQQQNRFTSQPLIAHRPAQITQHSFPITTAHQASPVHQNSSVMNYRQNHPSIHNTNVPVNILNSQGSSSMTVPSVQAIQPQQNQQHQLSCITLPPILVRNVFPDTPIGQARTQLQDQVFNAMDISAHLITKVQSLTNSNAYKQAKNYMEIKELYIHMSYLLSYAIGRFKGLQDRCLDDMRQLGFTNDADCLENGQLAAGVDYVCYGQLDDIDLFNTGSNSFHNQVYEYRKSLHANLNENESGSKSPLPPLFRLDKRKVEYDNNDHDIIDIDENNDDSLLHDPTSPVIKGHWLEGEDDSTVYQEDNDENDDIEDNLDDNDCTNDDDTSCNGPSISLHTVENFEKRRKEKHLENDRKLTHLVAKHPAIWCTRHPDYGNFEVTRKLWRKIGAHFSRSANIKLRWKNIRKRFVRIEKRMAQGKRFNGLVDKSTAFLTNRDLPEDEWLPVDCGADDEDKQNDNNFEPTDNTDNEKEKITELSQIENITENFSSYQPSIRPIDISELDLRIINYAKTHSVLWCKSHNLETDKDDELTRRHLWRELSLQTPQYSSDDLRDRWHHLYEMYKTFRLKTIKSPEDHSMLEIKYSKYLAKLYFLYKINEQEMKKDFINLYDDYLEIEDSECISEEMTEIKEEKKETNVIEKTNINNENNTPPLGITDKQLAARLQDMSDDKEFLKELVLLVKEYPAIWNVKHVDYVDIILRDNYWQEINNKLASFNRDVKTIKLRWQLAKFKYNSWKRQKNLHEENSKIDKYCKDLPIEEMSFLN